MSGIDFDRHKRPGYADPSPYPEVKIAAPNMYYAELLMDDYAGLVSEFTAISQYLYHYFSFKTFSKELAKLLENVAITEMLHMEILAGIIKKLGGDPVIRGSYSTNGCFWNGTFIYYGTTIAEQLKADIDSEYKAIEGYQTHIQAIGDPSIKAVLQRIILDEISHIHLFNQALRKYCSLEHRPYR